jgi:O-antigen ligase
VGPLIVLCILAGMISLVQGLPGDLRHQVVIRTLELVFIALVVFLPQEADETGLAVPGTGGWLFLVWWVMGVVSVVFSLYPALSAARQAEWMTHILFGFILWHYLRRNRTAEVYLLWAIPLGFLLVGLFEVGYWFHLDNPQSHDWCNGTPFFVHIRHFGFYAMTGLIFCCTPFIAGSDRFGRSRHVATVLGMTLCWAFLVWTGGRAAIGSAVVALAGILMLLPRRDRVSFAVIGIASATVGAWVATFFEVQSFCTGVQSMADRTFGPSFLTGRMEIWRSALAPMKGFRWLVGLGPDTYAFMPEKGWVNHPHSILVQFIVDWGVIGAVSMLVLLGLMFWTGYARLTANVDVNRRTLRVVAMATIGAYLVHSLVDGLFYHPQPLLFLSIMFAIVLLPSGSEAREPYVHPIMTPLTRVGVIRVVTIVLMIFFVLNSNAVYRLFL